MKSQSAYGEKWGHLTEHEEHAPVAHPNLPGMERTDVPKTSSVSAEETDQDATI